MSAPGPLAVRIVTAPRLSRPDLARGRLADWVAGLDPACSLASLAAEPTVAALLAALADHSPYLWRLATVDPTRLARLLLGDPAETATVCLDRMTMACGALGLSTADVMRLLRSAKAEIALLVALADLGGAWALESVTETLTRYADQAVRAALRFLLAEAQRAGKLRLPDPDRPEEGCGLVVLALGKQGGGELNYSSDIDITAFFDPACSALAPTTVAALFYVRLTQGLARMLSERTADGYALRVDLRLRPDPGSTAVAVGLPSAFAYYESHGQNWERAALIKARPVAGDTTLGQAFLRDLAPFIWRKYFDYATIADIHAMKRQIHAVKGHGAVAVAGHDVKLGRGGIREIEFFVQTQQLIFGGRRPNLRGARTLDMLAELQRDGWIDEGAVEDLSGAYRFMRGIEHRLQMIADEQTQRLPSEPEPLAAFAAFAGFADTEAFATAFTRQARLVESHYARLFEHEPELGGQGGNLVFTGVDDDPETLQTLSRMGFGRPAAVAETVRGWHFGRRAAVQSPRARAVLTALIPGLLQAFGRSGDPDAAVAAFDTALGRMPAAVELFAILQSNAALLELFGDILGTAPRLAATVSAKPHVLDAAVDPASLRSAGDADLLEARVTAFLPPDLAAEEFLDRARDLAQEELFLIGVRLLAGTDAPQRAAEAYSDFAAMMVRATLAHCVGSFEQSHGRMEGGACVVLAMGKLGSREMTAGSDLDLILIYDVDEAHAESTGPRPLDPARYYARLTQRLIAALTVATRRGRLYEVDMRLRPSGGQGPVATRLRSFVTYQAEAAEMWEHMALTRARVIAGDAALAARVGDAIADVLTTRRNPAAVRGAVRDMRALVAREKGEADAWNLKRAAGGLLDLEFLAQAMVLCHAAEHPTLLAPSTAAVLAEVRRLQLVEAATADRLIEALRLFTNLAQVIRLTVGDRFDPATVGSGVRRRVALAADLPDFRMAEAQMLETERFVRSTFARLIGDPAAAAI